MSLSRQALGKGGPAPGAAHLQGMGTTAAWTEGTEWRGLRDGEYTYAVHRRDGRELFHHRSDPYHLGDPASERSAAAALRDYRERSRRWRKERGSGEDSPQMADFGRRVALAGATGLIGQAILEGLLADQKVAVVHTLGRRASGPHPKLTPHVVDFAVLPELPLVDEVYLALGTTIKAAGSQQAFRAVDLDANLAVARAALAAGARRCGLVSAMGADPGSRIFYNRIKGELEESLKQLPFEGLVIARPSLLVGDRAALGQPRRPLEEVSEMLSRFLSPLIPANYRPVAAAAVAQSLLAQVPVAHGLIVMLSGELQGERSRVVQE